MEVSRGANLVGMSMMPPDARLISLLIKKKFKTNTYATKTTKSIAKTLVFVA
jgi:hypothetical protein